MAVDLKSTAFFRFSLIRMLSVNLNFSLLLMDETLIKLEHEYTQDRVRRFSYDSIQNVIIWQKIPWVRVILCTVFFLLPGVGLLFVGEVVATAFGISLAVLWLALVGWYFYCKITTIRIVRNGSHYDLSGLFRPGKLRRFRERLLTAIQTAQAIMQSEGPPAYESFSIEP